MKLSKKLSKKAMSSSSLTLDNMDQGMEDIYYDRNKDDQTTASGGVLDYIAGSNNNNTPNRSGPDNAEIAYDDLYSSYGDFSSSPAGKGPNPVPVDSHSANSAISMPSFSMPTMPSFNAERRKSKTEKTKDTETKEKADNSDGTTPRKCKADDIPVMDSPLRMQFLRASRTDSPGMANKQHTTPNGEVVSPPPAADVVHDFFDGGDVDRSSVHRDSPIAGTKDSTPEQKDKNASVIASILSSHVELSNVSTPMSMSADGTPSQGRSGRGSPLLPRMSVSSNNSDFEEDHAVMSAEYGKAVRTLTNVLGKGLTVIKYDSKGRPKAEIINCDPECTVLIWLPAHDPSEVDEEDIKEVKYVNIADITALRLGTEIDPATPNEALLHAAKEKIIPQTTLMAVLELKERERKDSPKKTSKAAKTVRKASSLFESLFIPKDKDLEILYGTEVLRDNCTPEQLKISFALFTESRVLNIQCLEKKDFEVLVKNLRIVTSPPPTLEHHIAAKLGKNPMKGLTRGRKSWKERSASVPGKVRSKSIGDLSEPTSSERTELMRKYHGTSSSSSVGGNNGKGIRSSLSRSGSKDDQDISVLGNEEGVALVPTKAFLDFMARIDIPAITAAVYEQNRYYGTNMYGTLKPGDEMIIENYMLRGYSMEVSLNRLFAKRILKQMQQVPSSAQSVTDEPVVAEATLPSQQYRSPPAPHHPQTQPYPPKPPVQYAHQHPSMPMAHPPPPSPYNMSPHMMPPPGYPHHAGPFSPYPPMQVPMAHHTPPHPSTMTPHSGTNQKDVKSKDIIKLGVTLFQQEQRYGMNMLDSLGSEDELELRLLQDGGLSANQAAQYIFEQKVASGVILPLEQPQEGGEKNVVGVPTNTTTSNEDAKCEINAEGKTEIATCMESSVIDEKGDSAVLAVKTDPVCDIPANVDEHKLGSISIDTANLSPYVGSLKAASDEDFDHRLVSLKASSNDSDTSVDVESFLQNQSSRMLSTMHPSYYGPMPGMSPYPPPGYPAPHIYQAPHSYPYPPPAQYRDMSSPNSQSSIYNPSPNSPYHPAAIPPHMYPYHISAQNMPNYSPVLGIAPSMNSGMSPATATMSSQPPLSRQVSVNEMLPSAMEASRPAISRTTRGFSWLFSGSTSRSLSSIDPRLTETDVQKIEDMGFTRDQAVSALMVNNYNLVMALNTLMDHR